MGIMQGPVDPLFRRMLYNRGVMTCIVCVILGLFLPFALLSEFNQSMQNRFGPTHQSTGNADMDAVIAQAEAQATRDSSSSEVGTLVMIGVLAGGVLIGGFLYGRYLIRLSESDPSEDLPAPPL